MVFRKSKLLNKEPIMNSLIKINPKSSTERLSDRFSEPFHYEIEKLNDENTVIHEAPSLQMRHMIDDYDELFGADTKDI